MDTETLPSTNLIEYSVTEIAGGIKRVIEDNFGLVRVRGEISGFKHHASGHGYFALKDDQSVIDAVCWKAIMGRLSFKAEDGLEVVCTGRVSTYPGRSKYQLIVTEMTPAGAGALMALLERRKQQLAAEGLFDPKRKKPLPFMPQTIGIVTSPTGAVIRDILHRLSERFPVHVLLWPVNVQGEGAAAQIAAAIQGFNQLPTPPDLIIVARGGGSVEDLWAFNEEIVVRAAANSKIPLISAVGHETDTTLIDYASDLRAPTPTAAAELAVPVRDDWLLTLGDWHQRLRRAALQHLTHRRTKLDGLTLPRPHQILDLATQRLDEWHERLRHAPTLLFTRHRERLGLLSARLRTPTHLLDRASDRLTNTARRLQTSLIHSAERHSSRLATLAPRLNPRLLTQRLSEASTRLNLSTRLLETLDHRAILKRGFLLAYASDGTLLPTAARASLAATLTLQFADGTLQTSPTGATPPNHTPATPSAPVPEAPARQTPKPNKKPTPPTNQGTLF